MLPDRWNPRLWLRDWLTKPSRAEAGSGQSLPNRMLIDTTTFGSVNTTAQGEPKAVEYGPFHVASGELRIEATGVTRGESR